MIRKTGRILITCVMAVTLVLSGCLGLVSQKADANAVDTLKIKVGYYGWNPSEYVDKASFSDGQIRSMPTIQCTYSYFDGSTRVAIDSARGVAMSSILSAAGIDQGSISCISFYTADSGNGAYRTKTMQELLLSNRYFFNDLSAYISKDENGQLVVDDEVWNSASSVQTMLAYEESWVWYNIGTVGTGPSWGSLTTQNRFRLNFGQQYPLETETSASAKMVHTMYVMFSGAPVITVDQTNISGKVGTKHKVKVTAAAADEALTEKVNQKFTYSSSDESVATVDEDGTIHIVGKGTATITISSAGGTAQITVNGGKTEGGDDGDGDGKGGKSDKPSDNPASESESKTQDRVVMYELSEAASSDLRLALAKQASAEEASMSTYQEEMEKDAEQLKLQKKKNQYMMMVIGASAALISACGAAYGTLSFRRQLGTRRIKGKKA